MSVRLYQFIYNSKFKGNIMANRTNQNDTNITEEEIETEYNESEFEGGDLRSVDFGVNSSIPTLNPLDSSSDDYRFASGNSKKRKLFSSSHLTF